MMAANLHTPTVDIQALREVFGDRLQVNIPLSRYTAARLGGPADGLIEVHTADEFADTIDALWKLKVPFLLLGGGSNVLISDEGLRGVAVLNRARKTRFEEETEQPTVWAEAGANFGLLARKACEKGLSGLEWAAGIPGSVGGAVVNNAGAFGSDIAACLLLADILHQEVAEPSEAPRRESWPVEKLSYTYRSSSLKRQVTFPDVPNTVVLAASLRLERSTPQVTLSRMEEIGARRRRSQPPGASLGSIFMNPPGDYAGRLIEAAGLKGLRRGDAEVSPVHANFFINHGKATAADILALIETVQQKVAANFGIDLQLEIEIVGMRKA